MTTTDPPPALPDSFDRKLVEARAEIASEAQRKGLAGALAAAILALLDLIAAFLADFRAGRVVAPVGRVAPVADVACAAAAGRTADGRCNAMGRRRMPRSAPSFPCHGWVPACAGMTRTMNGNSSSRRRRGADWYCSRVPRRWRLGVRRPVDCPRATGPPRHARDLQNPERWARRIRAAISLRYGNDRVFGRLAGLVERGLLAAGRCQCQHSAVSRASICRAASRAARAPVSAVRATVTACAAPSDGRGDIRAHRAPLSSRRRRERNAP